MEELMAKAKTAPAAGKAAIEKPFELVKDEPKKMRRLTTLDARPGEVEDLKRTSPNRGPQTGDAQMSDLEFLSIYADKKTELPVFRAAVAARRARAGTAGWRTLPNGTRIPGTMVLAGCWKCGSWVWVKPEHATTNCLACNFQNRVGGGKLRRATAAEEKLWTARETVAWAKFKASAPKRQAELDAFNRRRIEDGRT
jgi:hypothetical protein